MLTEATERAEGAAEPETEEAGGVGLAFYLGLSGLLGGMIGAGLVLVATKGKKA